MVTDRTYNHWSLVTSYYFAISKDAYLAIIFFRP